MESVTTELKVSSFRVLLLIVSLLTLSVLSAIAIEPANVQFTVLFTLAFVITFSLGIFISVIMLSIPNSTVKHNYGSSVIVKISTNGFAFLFPFAVLAFISDFLLQWNAVQAISCAAIFTCVSVSSAELINIGGKKTTNLIFSFLASLLYLSLYIVLPVAIKIVINKVNF